MPLNPVHKLDCFFLISFPFTCLALEIEVSSGGTKLSVGTGVTWDCSDYSAWLSRSKLIILNLSAWLKKKKKKLLSRVWLWDPMNCSLEKAMATHSSTLAWKIPWTEKPGRLQSMELLRIRHDWANSLSLFTFMHWRRKWQPTSVPGESQGQSSLVGCRICGHIEPDTTEIT